MWMSYQRACSQKEGSGVRARPRRHEIGAPIALLLHRTTPVTPASVARTPRRGKGGETGENRKDAKDAKIAKKHNNECVFWFPSLFPSPFASFVLFREPSVQHLRF